VNKELIINSSSNEVVIALLENKRLVELNNQQSNNNFMVGDLYLGKVRKIISGLNAAFIDVGYEKDAFLHYLDLGPQARTLNKYVREAVTKQGGGRLEDIKLEPDIEKTGKITSVLSGGQNILAQVAKEPISSKGPRITTEISIPGRYMVLIPFSDKISVSQKIKSQEERIRLKKLIQSIRPNNFGVIVRTAAENKKVAELYADLNDLHAKWESAMEALKEATPPRKILGEIDRTSAILRDLLNNSFNNIQVNDPVLYAEIRKYIQTIAPDQVDIVKLYKGKESIFEAFGIEKQIKSLFGKTVNIKSGAYLIIEHTEALHVIDVNSGHRMNQENNQETNALDVNLEAASEIARQLRLRDMGGIIVIDFIDLHNPSNRRALYQKLKDEMKNDRAKHTILPPSKFGLVQITRQRVRPETTIETLEKCPTCAGTGQIKASILLIDEIENNIKFILQELNHKTLTLSCHPFVFAHLTKGIFSIGWKWNRRFKSKIRITEQNSYGMLEYHFFDKEMEEIKI
jgi:ribonuclease G